MNNNKTLWQKIYPWLGFGSFYEYEGRVKYETFYWLTKKLDLFSYVVRD